MTPLCYQHRRRGMIALLTAISMIGLVTAAVLMTTQLVATDARRTLADQSDAQTRQLVLAAAVSAHQHLASWDGKPTSWSVPLPRQLADERASLSIHLSGSDADATADINTKLSAKSSTQSLQFHRTNGIWALVSAS